MNHVGFMAPCILRGAWQVSELAPGSFLHPHTLFDER